MEKSDIRAMIRRRKRAMTDEQIEKASEELGQLLRESPLYRQAKTIYGYLPYNQEVRTTDMLIRAIQDGKRVAVPKVFGDSMRFIYLDDLPQTAPGYAKIPEPIADGPVADEPDALVLMPGIAFDREGRRIGYGGGFYDRFLAEQPDHPTLALCYGFQVLDHLETEPFDIPVDQVIWTDIEQEASECTL